MLTMCSKLLQTSLTSGTGIQIIDHYHHIATYTWLTASEKQPKTVTSNRSLAIRSVTTVTSDDQFINNSPRKI